jgi:major membrane immunogen (membrane-anchored lipoprotein)
MKNNIGSHEPHEREQRGGKKRERTTLLHSFFTLLMAVMILGGCGNAGYRDGVYNGRSGEDDTGAWGEVTITIEEGKITACDFITREKDGTIKGEDYGKINGEISSQDYYDKAQFAVWAMEQYAKDYVEKQRLRGLDAISGATISWEQFNEAVEDALENARDR